MSQLVSVGSFFSWLPKIVAAWPAAGSSSSAAATALSANAVKRLLDLDIRTPLEIGFAQPATIVNAGPLRDALLPAASRAPTTTL